MVTGGGFALVVRRGGAGGEVNAGSGGFVDMILSPTQLLSHRLSSFPVEQKMRALTVV